MSCQNEVVSAIEEELRKTEKPERFRLIAKLQDGSVWKVWLSSENGGKLDESLEGARAWWSGPPKGTAAVLSVVPEEDLVVLRFFSGPLPPPESEIRIYPIRYLEKLRELSASVRRL